MLSETKKEDLFCEYYARWIMVYKKGAIRKVTMDKYLMTQKWLEKLIPELKIREMNRIAYQQLLNDYTEYHERQTTMDFHHQLNAYAACFAGSEGPGQLGLFYSSGRKDRDAFFGGTCPDPEGF